MTVSRKLADLKEISLKRPCFVYGSETPGFTIACTVPFSSVVIQTFVCKLLSSIIKDTFRQEFSMYRNQLEKFASLILLPFVGNLKKNFLLFGLENFNVRFAILHSKLNKSKNELVKTERNFSIR